MKLMALTDLHLGASRPAGRVGDYVADVDRKLSEVIDIANNLNVAAVLCAGDVFHSPTPTYSTLVRFQTFLERLNRRFIAIPGSHDLFGNNLDALYRTAIGFFDRVSDKFELLSEITRRTTRVGTVTVGVSGSKVLGIEMVHGSVLPTSDFGEYTLLRNYVSVAKIVLVGHYHSGYELIRNTDGVLFVCPGSLVRTTAQAGELVRRPRVAIISDNYEVVWKELICAKPGGEVLSPPVVSPQIDFTSLVREWTVGRIDSVNVFELLEEVGKKEGMPDDTLDYAVKFFRKQRGVDGAVK